jgi:hypothetical protein
MESSTNAAGLRGESATLPSIGKLLKRFLAPGGRGRQGTSFGGHGGAWGIGGEDTVGVSARRPWRTRVSSLLFLRFVEEGKAGRSGAEWLAWSRDKARERGGERREGSRASRGRAGNFGFGRRKKHASCVTGCRRKQAKGTKGGLEGWSLTRSKTEKKARSKLQ